MKYPNQVYNLYHSIPEKYRYGKTYRRYRKFLSDGQKYGLKDIQDWQFDQLKKIVTDAYQATNHYRNTFDHNNFHPRDLKTILDIQKVPFLEKREINENINDFVSCKVNKKNLIYTATSGTSGIPVPIYLTKDQYAIEMAFVHDIWSKYGHEENKKHAHLRGYTIDNKPYEIKGKNLILSSFQLNNENIFKYISVINEYKPDYLQAYPSSLTYFCQLIKENNIEPPRSIKLILCSSENLYTFQEKFIQKVFQIPIGNLYGHSESSVIAFKCPQSGLFHFYPHYGFVELINDNGEYANSEDELCEIVGTSFVNHAFPLIRYRTDDFGKMSKKRCPCGWNYLSLSTIVGRGQEFIITKKNNRIPIVLLGLNAELYDDLQYFQFYQDKVGVVEFRYIPKGFLSSKQVAEIQEDIRFQVRYEAELELKQVDNLEIGRNGKIPFLVQKLSV